MTEFRNNLVYSYRSILKHKYQKRPKEIKFASAVPTSQPIIIALFAHHHLGKVRVSLHLHDLLGMPV